MDMRDFGRDPYPGRPRVLFVGLPQSTHTREWIDLLDGARLNVRLFALPDGTPPDGWRVRTYVTAPGHKPRDPAWWVALGPYTFAARGWAFLRRRMGVVPQDGVISWLAEVIRRWRPHVVHTLGLEPASYLYHNAVSAHGIAGRSMWVVQARGGPDLALHRLLPEYSERIRAALRDCDSFIADNGRNYEYALELGLRRDAVAPLGVVPGTGGMAVTELARNSAANGPTRNRRLVLWPKAYECPQSKALPVFEALKLALHRLPACEIHMLAMIPETRMWFAALPEELRRICVPIVDRLPREETLRLMCRARVMLAPSLVDGVPNSLYEAMACGAFPIVSPLETITPVVQAERNVLFARNLYPQEIADALVRAMTDDDLVEQAARNNLELVRRIADRASIGPKVVAYYEELAARAGAGM